MRTYFSVFVIATLFVSAAIGQGSEKVRIDYSEVRIKEFPIAVQSYTYRKFSFMEAVDKAVELGIKNLQAYPGQKVK